MHRAPALAEAGIKTVVNGPITHTPDDNILAGPVAGLTNFWNLCGASIGIALYPQDGTNLDTLIKHADVAMYHVKGQGKNGHQFYSDEMNVPYIEKLSMDTGIHRALDNNEFNLVYQPQVNLRTGEIVGVEALLRWDHPEKGIIKPIDFVPVAEDSGLIVPIGEKLIRIVGIGGGLDDCLGSTRRV